MYNTRKFAYCELFKPKSALFYNDEDYHLRKYGAFLSEDFDISIGYSGVDNSGTVTRTGKMYTSEPVQVGDIVQVTLSNFPINASMQSELRSWNIGGGFATIRPYSRAFSVSAIDGNRLVLVDAVQYNHSLHQVGYVGNTRNKLYDIINFVSKRELRAYATKLSVPDIELDGGRLALPIPFFTDLAWLNDYTTIVSEFKGTNTTPFEVIAKACEGVNATFKNGDDDHKINFMIGASVEYDTGGPFLMQFISILGAENTVTMRIKDPTVKITNRNTKSNAATIWVQNGEGGDDYIKLGTWVRTKKGVKELSQVTPSDAVDYPITSIPAILMGWDEIRKFLPKYENSKTAPSEMLGNNEESKQWKRESIDFILKTESDKVRDFVNASLNPSRHNYELSVPDGSYYGDEGSLDGSTLVKVYYNDPNGYSFNGEPFFIRSIRYSQRGRELILQSK